MLKTFTIKAVPRTEACDDFPVLVRVTGSSQSPESSRPGLDLVAVLDVTGSMWGTTLEAMKRALVFLVDHLHHLDRLAIIKYSHTPTTLQPLTEMSDKGRAAFRDTVNWITPGGGDAGMDKALDVAAQILRDRDGDKDNRVGSIVFLSDGAGTACTTYCWCPEFPVHTFGFGPNHEPEILSAVADNTRGTYSSVDDVGNIVDALALFIGGLMSVTAMGIEINVHAHEGVTISAIESGSYMKTVKHHRKSGTVNLDNLYAGEEKNFIIHLTIPECVEELITIEGQYTNPMSSSMEISLGHYDVSIQRNQDSSDESGGSTSPTATVGSGFWRWVHGGHKISSVSSHVPCWTDPCPEVEAELVRLSVVKEVAGCLLDKRHMQEALVVALDHIEDAKEKLSTSDKSLLNTEKEVREMQELANNQDYSRGGLLGRYMLSWLSSQKWQRETTKGSPARTGAFRTSEMVKMLEKAAQCKMA